MPTPPASNLLLWLSADDGVSLDSNSRVSNWQNQQSGLPSFSQGNTDWRPAFVSGIFNGYPGVSFSDGLFLTADGAGIAAADFTLFVLGRSGSEQSPSGDPGSSGKRFLFQQTLNRGADSRPFLVAISVGSNGMAVYELNLDSAPQLIVAADLTVFCPLTVVHRESVPKRASKKLLCEACEH